MRHLNQDLIENFFGAIRSHGCRNTNPTPERFESALTTLLVNNLSSVHAPGANCEEDQCNALHALVVTKSSEAATTGDISLDIVNEITFTPIEEKSQPQIMGPLQYVAGYVLKKSKNKVFRSCEICRGNLYSEIENDFIKSREYASRHWLSSPSPDFLTCISNMQDVIDKILMNNLERKVLREYIKTIILFFLDFNFITCSEHREKLIDFIINLVCRFFMFTYCKNLNKIIMGKKDIDSDEDGLQCKARKYFKRCFKRKIK